MFYTSITLYAFVYKITLDSISETPPLRNCSNNKEIDVSALSYRDNMIEQPFMINYAIVISNHEKCDCLIRLLYVI